MSKSKIEWTESTWNPVVGCSKVSAGCKNCYAERMAWRLRGMGQKQYENVTTGWDKLLPTQGKWNGKTVFVESALSIPLKRKKATTYFVCSMSDLFHESVPFEWIFRVYKVFGLCLQHTFQVLTKRPERMFEFTQWLAGQDDISIAEWPRNVWLGTTVEHPDYKHRIDELRKIPASVKFLSLEPLLADLDELNLEGIDWVICGGESGPGARPMHPDWARNIRDQCKAAGVPFFFKQWGAWQPVEPQHDNFPTCGSVSDKDLDCCMKNKQYHDWSDWQYSLRVGKKKAGCLLDGVEYKEMPE